GNAQQVFNRSFHSRNQRQLGFYVLLASCGVNLDAQSADVLAEYPDAPLAQYLALHSSPVLRKHASQWAVTSTRWKDNTLEDLAVAHALLQRWGSDRFGRVKGARLDADRRRATDYVRTHIGSPFAWGLLCRLADSAGKDKVFHGDLAE